MTGPLDRAGPLHLAGQLDLAGRLAVPAGTAALLWDMDGVLLDTLTLDFEVVNAILDKHVGGHAEVTAETIRANFAYHPPEFFRRVTAEHGIAVTDEQFTDVLDEYEAVRRTATPPVHAGIVEILTAARGAGLSMAVVSNNLAVDVTDILANSGLLRHFDAIVGNDVPGLAKKPAPDPYIEGARRLGVSPAACVVVEDSVVGATSGRAAGCFVVGVATGGTEFDELSGAVDHCYRSFAP